MHLNRIVLSTCLVVFALVVQICVLARLQLPGAVPDLLLLVVLGLALVYGHTGGALIGFGAGLLADFAPPADHAAGRYALVLCVVGYLAGLAKPESGQLRSATGPMLVVVAAAIGATLLYAGVGILVGDDAARQVGLGKLLFTAALYDLLLAPFTVPLIMGLARRSENDPMADSAGGGESPSRWISTAGGVSTGRIGRMSRLRRPGRAPRIGSQRGGLLARTGKNRTTRIKGVKRL
ncbi:MULTISPECIES: rod shape-determining protein MreD [Streptomyces]|uniref:Rod shape-determining protein MreD n=1 Tax=Streptomyces rhizosphaericus TaxID=114699 RepID=A0A6G4AGU1_9ACTN|nr:MULTISPECIES: rod shape-determining protein MreD [Streptomyces]MBA6437227.1 rod shape-determining protein MreD [Streptomyces sp. GMR22]MBI0374803.1 rod shape-determining protein MreD [Streptomyces albiflaviniger]NEW72460.1 rod shape-determining protein MreD [Streptomyces rhizosphaericus]